MGEFYEIDKIPPQLNHPYIQLCVFIKKNSHKNYSHLIYKLDFVSVYDSISPLDLNLLLNAPHSIHLHNEESANIVNQYVLSHPDVEVETYGNLDAQIKYALKF